MGFAGFPAGMMTKGISKYMPDNFRDSIFDELGKWREKK